MNAIAILSSVVVLRLVLTLLANITVLAMKGFAPKKATKITALVSHRLKKTQIIHGGVLCLRNRG